jgi:hypothetical protein
MKHLKIILSLITVLVLLGIDDQAAGEDGLLYYGLILRGLVWLIIGANTIMLYEGLCDIAEQDGTVDGDRREHG